jgi:hypothetical protein
LTIEEAERFTLVDTPFRPEHLRKNTLAPAEKRGDLEVERPVGKRAGSFTLGTRLRFK